MKQLNEILIKYGIKGREGFKVAEEIIELFNRRYQSKCEHDWKPFCSYNYGETYKKDHTDYKCKKCGELGEKPVKPSVPKKIKFLVGVHSEGLIQKINEIIDYLNTKEKEDEL